MTKFTLVVHKEVDILQTQTTHSTLFGSVGKNVAIGGGVGGSFEGRCHTPVWRIWSAVRAVDLWDSAWVMLGSRCWWVCRYMGIDHRIVDDRKDKHGA